MKTIIVATPMARGDALWLNLVDRISGYRIIRIKSRDELNVEYLNTLNPEWIFFPHWSWIIPKTIHKQFQCVIFHMTNVPYGRGGSPLQNLIARGHKSTMLSAIKCVEEIDGGPVYKKLPMQLHGTAEEILLRASKLIAKLIAEIVEGRLAPVPQTGKVVEFVRRRKEDGNLSHLSSLQSAFDYIRMLDAEGYPPAFLETPHLHFSFTNARMEHEFVEATVRIRRKDR